MYSTIIGTGSALPERIVTNEELAQLLARDGIETSDEWIRTRTGIEARHFADPAKGETTTSMAVAAAKKALAAAHADPSEIDLIIVATTTPDMVFPSTACRVQAAVGAAGCAAFDVQAVCAGFIYALNAADAMLRAGPYRAALVIGAETMSRVLDMKERSTCVLFGDGAGAVVLRASRDPGVLAARMYADGRYDEKVLGLTARIENGRLAGDPFLRMQGREVFRLAVEGLVKSAEEVASLACVHLSDVALFVPHQANLRIMAMVAKKLGIAEERMVKTVAAHGNTSAASVPLALDAAVRRGMIAEGGLVLLQGIGAGMAWGSALVRWTKA
jgi:3-oxoacyl-[acyl-carrier-protein] synthase-3